MPLVLFLAFLAIPLLELWVILQVGDVIGAWWTVLVLVADSVLGAVIVRREGRRAWRAFREAIAETRWPGDEVAQGGLVLVGGALLLTPGFITDVAGLLCVLSPTRRLIALFIRTRLTPMPVRIVDLGAERLRPRHRPVPPPAGTSSPPPAAGGDVIDVEVVSVEPDDDDR
jgi:UPF0716 protein FxsA